jgi:hypothetical protein
LAAVTAFWKDSCNCASSAPPNADVARPRRPRELGEVLGGGELGHLLGRRGEPPQEVRDQLQQIGEAIAQRRQRDAEHGEPVVEIGAERPGVDAVPEIAIGRGDDPDVTRELGARPVNATGSIA